MGLVVITVIGGLMGYLVAPESCDKGLLTAAPGRHGPWGLCSCRRTDASALGE